MATVKIKLKNESGVKVKVKEGNAGIMRLVTTLDNNKTFEISHDPYATYREYTLMLLPDRTALRTISSDDFNDWKRIKIYRCDNGICDWMGTDARDPSRRRNVHPSTPVVAGTSAASTSAVGANGVGNGVVSGANVTPQTSNGGRSIWKLWHKP